ncbi:MraY family glycosyltransferase [Geotalea uraniireducens]|uniref:Glycosyl transferase, family 4 n=1 Tax=Geotalea uraniireducens (strain Rf4) TaxID=351605 RepID=A5G4P4_GEOUR|nr:MraY family glycosyltransferase [Geotalea uraniireducens]ABQ26762.1 glycosyl transferase, family 4 [Geotalea uraniireducens Rf4]
MIFLSTLLMSVLITIALIPVFSRLAISANVVDIPNERKVHTIPVPRIGGVAMALGAFAPILYWNRAGSFVQAYLFGAGVLVVFGLIDDFRELSPRIKFAGQFIAALIAVFWGGVTISSLGMLFSDNLLLPGWLAVPLTVIAIVGVTNAINLSDGLDGLAGGICLLSFCCISYLAYLVGNGQIGLIALSLAGVIFGFLRFNTHPASIFMGDAGSQFLGYSAIVLALSLTQGNTPLSPLLPLIILGFPVLDTLTVMLTRMVQRRSPFAPDKNHFHHNLMALGLRHPEAVLVIYLFQVILVVSAYYFRFYPDWLLLCGYLLFSLGILAAFHHAGKTGWRIKRYDLFDIVIVGRLRKLRDDGVIIRYAFRIFEFGVPLLLLFTCMLPREVPTYISRAALIFAVVILLARSINKELMASLLRFTLYLLIPFSVFLSDRSLPQWLDGSALRLYNASFAVFALLIIIVSKFTRRREGFKNTPLDFLILFIAVLVPNLPDQHFQNYHLGLVAAKIIMLYFSYEVLLAELRWRVDKVALVTVLSLVVLAVG